jgi:hypothetical protein
MATVSPFTDSRLGPGTLTLGPTATGTDYSAQLANVVLTPSVDSTDGTPTLATPDPLPEQKETWALEGSAIQDFEEAAGFVNYCFDHSGELVDFTWTPVAGTGTVVYAGKCKLTAVPIGGDAGVQITSDFSFAVEGKPTKTPPTILLEASSGKAAK